MELDFERCYRAVESRDSRFDGWWFTAVTSTGIYCRPSCPARTPQRRHVVFLPTAAAAQRAGFRACKRCRPDASPGSPEWATHDDVTARAMRLIADGAVDRDGVGGLATRLGYSERQLHRHLVASVGAGPLALARAQRAQTARVLAETTDLPLSDVAFGAGFSSIRQFNDTVRTVFSVTPTELRRSARAQQRSSHNGGALAGINLRLAVRVPFDGVALLEFLRARAVLGIEQISGGTYRRSVRLPHGYGLLSLTPEPASVACRLELSDIRDLAAAVQRCRRLFDLDADPVAVDGDLGADPLLGPLVRSCPGRRVPSSVDGAELAVRAVLGQQVTVGRGRDLAALVVARHGTVVDEASPWRLFPTAAELADADLSDLPVPASRRRAVSDLCQALANGKICLDPGSDRREVESQLLELAGIGPWTAAYIALRALGDPDAFLPSDVGVRRAMELLGQPSDPAAVAARAESWRPWRSYALGYLWASLPG